MGLFCLDRWALPGSVAVHVDQALREKVYDLGPPCLLLVWDVKYMQIVIYFIL